MGGFVIDDVLASFLSEGNSMVVATRNASLRPEATRACAVRVEGPDRLMVLLPRATSVRTLANLQENGDVAVCVSSPAVYRAVQLKGRFRGVGEPTAEDLLHAEQQFRGFADAVAPLGVARAPARNLWLFDCWRVEIQVTCAFEQTPGPGAGARLESRHGG